MHTFRDNAGRSWEVAVDVAAIKRVRSLLGIDLLGVLDGGQRNDSPTKGFDPITRDPVIFVDVLYVLCKLEADRIGVTDEEFGRALGGDALREATDAFTEAFISFCPNPRDRTRMRRAVEHMSTLLEHARVTLDNTLEQRIEQVVNSHLAARGDSSGNSLEPSELTRTTSRCENSA